MQEAGESEPMASMMADVTEGNRSVWDARCWPGSGGFFSVCGLDGR